MRQPGHGYHLDRRDDALAWVVVAGVVTLLGVGAYFGADSVHQHDCRVRASRIAGYEMCRRDDECALTSAEFLEYRALLREFHSELCEPRLEGGAR